MNNATKHPGHWLSSFAALAAAALAGGGCVHGSAGAIYGPDGAGPGAAQGPAASRYNIPESNPAGTAYVMLLGTELLPSGTGGADEPFFHVRLAASNDRDGAAWTLDSRDQLLRLPDGQQLAPAFAETSATGHPLVIAAGQRGHVDLWYRTPAAQTAPAGNVSLVWQVRRGQEIVARQTEFQGFADQNTDEESGEVYASTRYQPVVRSNVYLSVGPGWWWGPYYSSLWWDYPYGYGYGYGGYYGYGGLYGRGYYGGYYGGPRYYGGGRGYGGGSFRGYSGGGGGSYSPGRTSVGSGFRGGGGGGARSGGGSHGGGRSPSGGFRGSPARR